MCLIHFYCDFHEVLYKRKSKLITSLKDGIIVLEMVMVWFVSFLKAISTTECLFYAEISNK